MNHKGPVSGKVSADVKLDRFPKLFQMEDQRMDGRLTAELSMSGSIDSPEMQGSIQISGGIYEHARQGMVLKDIHVNARLENHRLIIERAQAIDAGNGTVTSQGWIDILPSKDFPLELKTALSQLTLILRDELEVTTAGAFSLNGNLDAITMSGALVLGPVEVRIPDRLPPEIEGLEVKEINVPAAFPKNSRKAVKRTGPKISLDLNMEFPEKCFVRGRGLDSEWRGKLHFKGDTGEPVITGTLSVHRGRFNFFGKVLSIKSGVLSFIGTSPPSPYFDVIAEKSVHDITAIIKVSGTFSSFNVALESDPPLPEDEVLSRLLFGRGVAQISPIQALNLANAVNKMAGGRSDFDFIDGTRRMFGIDQLEVKQGENNYRETSVSMGKYVTEGVYLEAEKGLGNDAGNVSVEIELTPNISFESEVGLDSEGGVGLNWRWNY
jgi:translocation and assembly module TamB